MQLGDCAADLASARSDTNTLPVSNRRKNNFPAGTYNYQMSGNGKQQPETATRLKVHFHAKNVGSGARVKHIGRLLAHDRTLRAKRFLIRTLNESCMSNIYRVHFCAHQHAQLIKINK